MTTSAEAGGMSRTRHVFIICSPRPASGKTLLTRLVAEFYRSEARPVNVYDLSDQGVIEFLPTYTKLASIADIHGQMALFDRLAAGDEVPKVVDLGHEAFADFFTILGQIDFVGEARRHAIEPVILYIADSDPLNTIAYSMLLEKFPELSFLPVRNDAIARGLDAARLFPPRCGGVAPLHLPQLSDSLRAMVDRRPFSFLDLRRNPPSRLPLELHEELEAWLKLIFLQLRELELQLMMGNLMQTLTRRQA